MRKYLIAALVLAAGCDATRRDFGVCDLNHRDCLKGFTCNLTTGMCETTDAALLPVEVGGSEAPADTSPVEIPRADALDVPAIDGTPGEVQTVDASNLDVPIGSDGALETRAPDAPGICSIDADCAGSARPYCVNNQCVACRANSHCSNTAGTPFCSAVNTCVSCAAATGDGGICSGSAPVCDPGSGRCVECNQNSDCPTAGKAFCVANQCVGCQTPGASGGGGAGGDGGAKDGGGAVDAGVVGPCSGSKPVCATSGALLGQCVQCLASTDCAGGTPICSSANLCTACTSDSQCASLGGGPGICMSHQDGRCASEAETIYVKNSSSCTGGTGTAATPYCDTQAAMTAVTSSKRVIVVKGPAGDGLSPISSTPTGKPISIIGQNNATTAAGAAIGIHVTAGDVFVRGLTVAGGSKVGIQVDAGATLRLDRCIVKNNAGGGLIVSSGANFDVANCVFDNNGPGSVNTIVPFGGVYLGGAAPASGPHTFWFSTIVNNQDRGLVCADSSQALSGMLINGNVNGGWVGCTMDSTNSKWDSPGAGSDVGDPAFSNTNPYHLTTSSRCRDFVAASLAHPSDDLDGDSRPYPATGKLDCGADEYRP